MRPEGCSPFSRSSVCMGDKNLGGFLLFLEASGASPAGAAGRGSAGRSAAPSSLGREQHPVSSSCITISHLPVSYFRDFFFFLTISIQKSVLFSNSFFLFAFLSPFSSLRVPCCRTACTNLSCSSTPSVTTNSSSIPPSFSSSTRKTYLPRRSRNHL